jgi:hypothetical protein
MQIHGPSETPDTDTFTARLNPGTDHPFAVVEMGGFFFFAVTPEECDAAIRVWVEAKRLLLGQPESTWCPATLDDGEGGAFYCDRERGHAGSHHAPGTDEGSEIAWSNEEDDDAPQCRDGHVGEDGDTTLFCRERAGHDGLHQDAGLTEWDDTDPGHRPGALHELRGAIEIDVIAGDFGAEIVNGGAK